jgi:hypothetical protein
MNFLRFISDLLLILASGINAVKNRQNRIARQNVKRERTSCQAIGSIKNIIKLTLPKETGRLSMANGEVRAEIA